MNRRLRSLLPKLALLAVSSLLALLVLEGLIRTLDLFKPLRAAARSLEESPVLPSGNVGRAVLHPFLGWTVAPRPQTEKSFLVGGGFFPGGVPSRWAVENSRINAFGYRSAYDDYREFDEEDFVVGVLGGSVAAHLVIVAGDHLRSAIEERFPHLEGRVVVLNLGGGGYKQPQQVMTLVEMSLLGVELDLVLNVDGFNEVVFGAMNAHERGVHPFFPSYAHYNEYLALVTGRLTPERIEQAASIVREKKAAAALVEIAVATPVLRRSEAFAALAGGWVRRHRRQAVKLEALFQAGPVGGEPELPVARLGDPCLDGEDCWELIADMWAEGSHLLHAMATQRGIPYVHFLQPNQYVPGSKVLSVEERETAYLEGSVFARNVGLGYPYLVARGKRLRREGVRFHNLTGLFHRSEETLYVDGCCHLNVVGYRRMATRIVRLLPDLE